MSLALCALPCPPPIDRVTADATPQQPDTPPQAPHGTDDLGLGSVVASRSRGRFLTREGISTSRKYGLGAQRAERFYLAALDAGWLSFMAWLIGLTLLLNGCFALAYMSLGPQALYGTESLGLDDPFLRALSFSVAVFTTTGTGAMHAVGATAHWLVVFESLLGPIMLIIAAGVLIARMTRPRMQLRFTEGAVVAPYEGGRGLMFRFVNVQRSDLSDVHVHMNLSRYEQIDGKRERNFHELELERSSVEMFPLHWTVVHPLTANSPLAGMTPESMAASQAELLIFVSAHEATFSTRVTAKTSYLYDEIRWDAKWASVFTSSPDDVIAIDVDRLDRTEQLPEGSTTLPAAIELATGPARVN